MDDFEKHLQPVDDGLPIRESNEYARYKLKALEIYIQITNTAMRDKPWAERYYIDLQAGPGKNKIGNEILLGSPLIALLNEYPFTQYRFNELNPELAQALQQRINTSPLHNRVKIYQKDANEVVTEICDEIRRVEKSKTKEQWSTLNLAFLDPEGLELHWSTVEQLAQISKMDFIINFSTSGIIRSIGANYVDAVNRFFGNADWQSGDLSGDIVKRRRSLIDIYLNQLKKLDYFIEIDPELGTHDISFKNSRNTEVYSLIFASKSQLGDKFWRQARKSSSPRRLPGFGD